MSGSLGVISDGGTGECFDHERFLRDSTVPLQTGQRGRFASVIVCSRKLCRSNECKKLAASRAVVAGCGFLFLNAGMTPG